jgi:hypothetical protein
MTETPDRYHFRSAHTWLTLLLTITDELTTIQPEPCPSWNATIRHAQARIEEARDALLAAAVAYRLAHPAPTLTPHPLVHRRFFRPPPKPKQATLNFSE